MGYMNETVYIVEDDLDIGELVHYLLVGLGKDAHVLPSVRAFRQRMLLAKPQLILMDIRLPDGNGIAICDQLKDDPATKDIPVLMMTANDNMLSDGACRADGILQKPFGVKDFETSILKHLTNGARDERRLR